MTQVDPHLAKTQDTGTLCALGIEERVTRACLLENVNGEYRLAGWLSMQRSATEGEIAQQLATTCRRLGGRLGRQLWNEVHDEPLRQSDDAVRLPALAQVAIVASPRAHVRAWLVGLSNSLSLAAARQALASSPVQLIGSTCLLVTTNSRQLATALADAQPEALIVVGGYDEPELATQRSLLLLCEIVGQACQCLPPAQRPTLFYAGNQWAAPQAELRLRGAEGVGQLHMLPNLQPAPGVLRQAELAVALSYYYWRLCERTTDFTKLSRWVTSPGQITNLESSFAQLVQAWMIYQDLPVLHALYCAETWWLHVWASQAENGVRMHFAQPKTRSPALAQWPPLQLVSGEWPLRLWPPPALAWCDHNSLAPLVAGLGQAAPLAMLQTLTLDVLEPYGRQRR